MIEAYCSLFTNNEDMRTHLSGILNNSSGRAKIVAVHDNNHLTLDID
jgi:hypothetical protein